MVNITPNIIFKIRFILGANKMDKATIPEDMDNMMAPNNNRVGLFRIFSPEIKLFTLSGVYNSK